LFFGFEVMGVLFDLTNCGNAPEALAAGVL